MSTPDQTESVATPPEEPETPWYTEEDVQAALRSAFWYATHAAEITGPYRGMHIAVFGEQIIDADRDKDALCRRLAAKGDTIPPARLVLRYVPTDEEAMRFRY